MKALLGFHFRNDSNKVRGAIFQGVKPIVESLYPWAHVFVHDSGHEVYNRAASRNQIFQYAQLCGYNVAVVCDADSIPEEKGLRNAIDNAYHSWKVVIPFNAVKVLAAAAFIPRPTRYKKQRPLFEYGESFGGCYVSRPEVWEYIGGMEERIEGWGFEDQIVLSAVRTFERGPVFMPGTLYTINHFRDKTSLANDNNDAIIRRYHAAEGNPEVFRYLQSGSNSYFAE